MVESVIHAQALIKLQMAKIDELAQENERLKAGLGAHGVLKLLYSDEKVSQTNRIKAAIGALPHETPKLQPVQQLELSAEPPPEPLADVITRQRARMERMQGQQIEVSADGRVRLLKPGSNGKATTATAIRTQLVSGRP